jgi:regulatory protein
MFGKPRQIETEAELYDSAIKILMRRAHSVSEMKKALARRCEDETFVRSVVERLKRENLLDDARYARQFTRYRTESRKQGQFRIARDLRARGVPDRHIEAAIKGAAEDSNPQALIRQRIQQAAPLAWRNRRKENRVALSFTAGGGLSRRFDPPRTASHHPRGRPGSGRGVRRRVAPALPYLFSAICHSERSEEWLFDQNATHCRSRSAIIRCFHLQVRRG